MKDRAKFVNNEFGNDLITKKKGSEERRGRSLSGATTLATKVNAVTMESRTAQEKKSVLTGAVQLVQDNMGCRNVRSLKDSRVEKKKK